ncbi:MAG: PAS domain-containing protein [Chitinispirillales bacterium]|jgi:PAS domain-containing protein|nr:PAS domain-containing protein [Chitinispirillales bacterium]
MEDIFNTAQTAEALNTMKNVLNSLVGMVYVTVPETGEILFISESMKQHYKIDGDVTGQTCYKVLQSNINERCPFCPCHRLDKEPDSTVVWEEYSTMTKRIYRNTDRYMNWPGMDKVHFQHSVDITEVKEAEALKQTRKADECMQLMFDTMPLCANYWTRDYKISGCNDGIVRLFGLKDKQEYAARFLELLPEFQPDGRPSAETTLLLVYKAFEEGYCRLEWMMQNVTGEPIPVDVTLVRVKHGDDDIVIMYVRDLREMKVMIKEIERMVKRQTELEAEMAKNQVEAEAAA